MIFQHAPYAEARTGDPVTKRGHKRHPGDVTLCPPDRLSARSSLPAPAPLRGSPSPGHLARQARGAGPPPGLLA